MQSLKKKKLLFLPFFWPTGDWLSVTQTCWFRRDCVLGRPCTPIHCLCDAYLGYTNPCYKVALQSVIIANTLD